MENPSESKGIWRAVAVIEAIVKGAGIVCGVIILLIGLLQCADVVARYFFNSPLGWTFELNNYMFVFMAFIGGAYALLAGSHVRIDIVYGRLSPRTQKIVDLATSVLALAYLFWLDWLVFRSALRSVSIHEVSLLQGWTLGPVRMLLPIGTTLLIIQLLINMGKNYSILKKQKEA